MKDPLKNQWESETNKKIKRNLRSRISYYKRRESNQREIVGYYLDNTDDYEHAQYLIATGKAELYRYMIKKLTKQLELQDKSPEEILQEAQSLTHKNECELVGYSIQELIERISN